MQSGRKDIMEWVGAIIFTFALVFFVNSFLISMVNVDGDSMLPTIQNNDKIIVWRFEYSPELGDVVVFKPDANPERPYIKRVIAVEGQTVSINDGKVFVNGAELAEDYVEHFKDETKDFGTVPKGHIFVLGDNRANSRDSRDEQVGFVRLESVVGKAVFRIWSFDRFGFI